MGLEVLITDLLLIRYITQTKNCSGEEFTPVYQRYVTREIPAEYETVISSKTGYSKINHDYCTR